MLLGEKQPVQRFAQIQTLAPVAQKGTIKKFYNPKIKQEIIIPMHKNDCLTYYKVEASNIIKSSNIIFP